MASEGIVARRHRTCCAINNSLSQLPFSCYWCAITDRWSINDFIGINYENAILVGDIIIQDSVANDESRKMCFYFQFYILYQKIVGLHLFLKEMLLTKLKIAQLYYHAFFFHSFKGRANITLAWNWAFWTPSFPHFSICQHCPTPLPKDDASIRPSIFILSMKIVYIIHLYL